LNTAINNADICNLILGHWDHALDKVYAQIGDKGLADAFKKGQYALSIESGEIVKEIQEKVDSHAAQVTAQQRELDTLRRKLAAMEEREAEREKRAAEMADARTATEILGILLKREKEGTWSFPNKATKQ
jgi:hypothetical protein